MSTIAIDLPDTLNKYGQYTVCKAHAYYLLARRGYRVPVQGIDRHQL
jgi:hypothetical protein